MAKPRRNLNKTTKECPAPQSEAPTLLLTPFSTHLSFRWTLPLIDLSILRTDRIRSQLHTKECSVGEKKVKLLCLILRINLDENVEKVKIIA
jgi:hypothetical protein